MSSQITVSKKESYYEVLEILKLMDIEEVEKIPKNLLDFLNKNKAENYSFKINKNLPFENQKLKEETRVILAMLNLNYWSSEKHKKELLDLYKSNQEKYEKEIRDKYNSNSIIQKKIENNTLILNKDEQIKKEKWYKKIYNQIIRIVKGFRK